MGCHFLLQGSFGPRNGTWVSCIAGRFFTIYARSIIIKKLGNLLSILELLHLRLYCFNWLSSISAKLILQNNLFPIMLNNWSIETITKHVSECTLLSHVRLFTTPWTVAYQAPPSMEFPKQEYWSGLPLPSYKS